MKTAQASPAVSANSERDASSITRSDLSNAVPLQAIGKLPSTEERYRTLKSEEEKTRPDVEKAKTASATLKAETISLKRQLILTANRVQALELRKLQLDQQIAELSAQEARMQASFARDRVAVAHLLGILERLQHDLPPVLALNADDALGAAHGAMLLGASLPRVYGAAADLARRLEALRRTRAQLVVQRAESARNAIQLSAARVRLNQLIATKQVEADTASTRYDKLAAKYAVIAKQASDLGELLQKVAVLRAEGPGAQAIVVVGPEGVSGGFHLKRGDLMPPVVGHFRDGGVDGVGGKLAPGVTYSTQGRAEVVAPADSVVLYARPYHKMRQVLILEMAGGYDLVLAGLDRLDVRVGDQLLAGEPLGTMPPAQEGAKLYFELRHNKKGMSPAPWLAPSIRKAERS